jgi:hypothetical protein
MTDGGTTPDGIVMTDGGTTPDGIVMTDGGTAPDSAVLPDAGSGTCDPLAQTGCTGTQKCTWIDDTATSGHIGCVANGSMATGAACTFGAVGPTTGFDNCVRGDYCNGGTCETLCDPNGGTPMCDASHACQSYDGLFGVSGGASSAGLCDPSCNPLDDNDFDGSGAAHTKAGSACGSDPTIGCYGIPSASTTTHFSCASPVSGTQTFHHRAVLAANQQFLNSCAPGYTIAFATDAFGSTNVDCYAYCKPGEAYLNNPGTQQPNGVSPHGCNTTDALGAFGAVPTAVNNGTNGEHCMYSWLFEIDDNTGAHLPSPTSNTVGICWDHSKYRYDSNGDGQVTAADAILPACTSLPLTSGSGGLTAGDVGCVTTTTAGVSFTGKPAKLHRILTNLPELPAFRAH